MDNLDSDDSLRRGIKHHQFYGRREWHYGGVCIGLAGAIGITKCRDGVRGAVADLCGDAGGCGVLLLQFPAEGEGQMLRRRCGLNRSGIYPPLSHRLPDSRDGRCDISHLPAGLWRGRLPDHRTSHPAARKPG